MNIPSLKSALWTTLAIVAALLSIGCTLCWDMPVKWADTQGGKVVQAIKKEFKIPLDPMTGQPAIYHSGWAYRRGGVWNTGSGIKIHGLTDTATQDAIIARTSEIVAREQMWDVCVSFRDHPRYEKEGRVTKRIEGDLQRRERITGITRAWRGPEAHSSVPVGGRSPETEP